MKLSNTQIYIIAGLALAVLLFLAWPCLKTQYSEHKNDLHVVQMSGQEQDQGQDQQMMDLASYGANRSLGYGSNYHIVGEKEYACSNDINDLTKIGCGVDDYSIWQDGSKKDFVINPTYGIGGDGCGHAKHPIEQSTYNYRQPECGCVAGKH